MGRHSFVSRVNCGTGAVAMATSIAGITIIVLFVILFLVCLVACQFHSRPCPLCRGTAEYDGRRCPLCSGTGEL